MPAKVMVWCCALVASTLVVLCSTEHATATELSPLDSVAGVDILNTHEASVTAQKISQGGQDASPTWLSAQGRQGDAGDPLDSQSSKEVRPSAVVQSRAPMPEARSGSKAAVTPVSPSATHQEEPQREVGESIGRRGKASTVRRGGGTLSISGGFALSGGAFQGNFEEQQLGESGDIISRDAVSCPPSVWSCLCLCSARWALLPP